MGEAMSTSTGGSQEGLDLADAVTLLRDQVVEARRRLADPTGPGAHGVEFTLGDVTLELGLELTGTKGVNGGLRWSVLSLGAKKESTRQATHTLTVTLRPHETGGGDINVRDVE
ncbi:hypothetical protein GXW82_01530 [Streptacidiphilus sp. 4-A2]|nr:hypothetical protein [Streptacidiphilus sp. 4-A2]